MQCGIFGKLPAKRDFVSYNIPRPFLNSWENWLQAAIADSQHAMGDHWTGVFLTLPIWYFWCGPEVFGQAAAGAVMPSVDAVGRYFPLSICAVDSSGEWPVLPHAGGLNIWLAACENALLSQLEEDANFEAGRILEQVGVPEGMLPKPTSQDATNVQIWSAAARNLQAAFSALADSDLASANHQRGIWWTSGSENHPAQLITTRGPAQPSLWTTFMMGHIAA
jgi:type VI secretion system protein ImpM